MCLKRQYACWALCILLFLWADSPLFAASGPLQTLNRFPLHLMFLKPRPVKALQVPAGGMETTLAVEYSNTYFEQHNSHWDVLIDMELMVVDLSLVYGVTSTWALKLDLPMVSMSDGFLDGLLGNYHDVLGVGNYDREDRPGDTFGYRVSKDGTLWLEGQSGALQCADTTVSVQYALVNPGAERTMASSLLFSLKLPTGETTRGFGSGAYDVGLYLPTQWSGDPWSFYLMPAVAFIGDPHTGGADVATRNSVGLFAGVAYDYSERWTWLAQTTYYGSPVEQTGIAELDDGTLALDLGFHYRTNAGYVVEFAFCEDLTRAAPDFNLRLGVRWVKQSW